MQSPILLAAGFIRCCVTLPFKAEVRFSIKKVSKSSQLKKRRLARARTFSRTFHDCSVAVAVIARFFVGLMNTRSIVGIPGYLFAERELHSETFVRKKNTRRNDAEIDELKTRDNQAFIQEKRAQR